jgi:hypothetical protein
MVNIFVEKTLRIKDYDSPQIKEINVSIAEYNSGGLISSEIKILKQIYFFQLVGLENPPDLNIKGDRSFILSDMINNKEDYSNLLKFIEQPNEQLFQLLLDFPFVRN